MADFSQKNRKKCKKIFHIFTTYWDTNCCKNGKIPFFPAMGGVSYWDFDYFFKSFCGNGMDLYRRDAARHVSTSGCPAAAVKTPSPLRLERPKITNVTFGTRL